MDFNKHSHYDEVEHADSNWAMDVIEKALAEALWQPPKFSTLNRYLKHQYILLESELDQEGNAPESLTEDCFPGNPNPPHTYSLEGTMSAKKPIPPQGWCVWDSTLVKERNLYVPTDSMNQRLRDQYLKQGRVAPIFRDERLKTKTYPMFVRDDINKQEMRLNFDQIIE